MAETEVVPNGGEPIFIPSTIPFPKSPEGRELSRNVLADLVAYIDTKIASLPPGAGLAGSSLVYHRNHLIETIGSI